MPLLGQRLGQEPERDAGQQDDGAGHYEAQPPGPHPAGVLVVDGDGVWERKASKGKDSKRGRVDCWLKGTLMPDLCVIGLHTVNYSIFVLLIKGNTDLMGKR